MNPPLLLTGDRHDRRTKKTSKMADDELATEKHNFIIAIFLNVLHTPRRACFRQTANFAFARPEYLY